MDFQQKIKNFLAGVTRPIQPAVQAVENLPQNLSNFGRSLSSSVADYFNPNKANFSAPSGQSGNFFSSPFGQSINNNVINPQGILNPVQNAKSVFQPITDVYQNTLEGVKQNDPINQFAYNRVIKPIEQIPQGIQQAFSPDATPVQRFGGFGKALLGGLQTAGNIYAPGYTGAYSLFDAYKNAALAKRQGTDIGKAAIQGLTGEQSTGLGTAASDNPIVASTLNLGELISPFAPGEAKRLGDFAGRVKGVIGRTPNSIHPQDVEALDMANEILHNKNALPQEIAKAKQDVFNLAERYLSPKDRPESGNPTEIIKKLQAKSRDVSNYGGLQMGLTDGSFSRSSSKPSEQLKIPTEQAKYTEETPPGQTPPPPYQEDISAKNQTFESNATQNPSIPDFNAKDYLKEQVKKQDEARSGEKLGIKDKLGKFYSQLKEQLIDSNAPIEDVLNNAEKKGKFQVLPTKDIRLQIDKALRSDTLAGQFIKDNGLSDVIRSAPDLSALDQYMIAKHSLQVASNGIKTGRDAEKDQQLVNQLGPTYEPLAQKVNEYSKKLLDYSVDSGLVSKETADMLKKKYPNYVPLNRIFSEDELATQTPKGTGRGLASLSKQTVVQKLQGSEREIENPIASLTVKTQDAFNQGERNRAAQQLATYKDLPDNPFNITPLRTAENVQKRIDLFGKIHDLGIEQRKVDTLIKTRNSWAGKLKTQINNLNKEGLNISLKVDKTPPPDLGSSSIKVKKLFERPTIKTVDGNFKGPAVVQRDEFGNPKIDIQDQGVTASKEDVKQFINSLINEDPAKLAQIKKKIAVREPKLASILDTISELRDHYNSIKQEKSNLIDEAALARDAESRGKATFSVLNNGIKEIYETTPEIATAAKSLNKEQMGLLAKIVSVPTRILRLGATGLNYPFAFANLVKDQSSAFINSKNSFATQNPVAFTKGLFAALGHGKLYDEVVRNAAGGTSFDIGRENPNLSVEKIRAGKNVFSNVKYKVTHPAELLRTAEDLIGRTEELTRAQQYHGMYSSLIKQGRTPEDARLLAAQAARNNTVNFARGGSFSKVLNWIIPYFNAGVQGSRTFVRNVQNRPVQTLTKFAIGAGMPIAAATAWNLSDPDRKKAYDDISDFEKQNSIIIVPPNPTKNEDGTWNVIKIPLSQEIASLGSLVRRPMEAAAGLDPVRFGEIANALIQTGTSLNTSSGTGLMSSLTPQIAKPGVEAVTNTNLFTGRRIVPDSLKNLPPDEQIKKGTSGTARIIAKPLGVSPLLVQNEASTIMGGLGPQLLSASDTVLNKTGVIPDNQVSGKSVGNALQKRFALAQGGDSEQKLMDNLKKGLSPKETQAYDLLHTPRAVDSNGNAIPDNSILNTPQKALLYLNNPKLQEIDRQVEIQKPNHDPVWDLNPAQRNLVLASRIHLPGEKNDEQKQLSKTSWYPVFQQAESSFFQSLPSNGQPQSNRPQPSDYVQQQMNAKNWGDPQVKAYLDASTAYNNAQREKLGLSPIASFAGRGKRFRNPFGNPRAFARTSSTSKGYKSIAKSSKSVQVKLPKLSVKLPKSKTLTKAGKAFKLKA